MDVLVVDDSEADRLLVVRALARARPGLRIVEVASGEEALRAAERQGFDLIITDYRLGRMNGVELLERILHESPTAGRVLLTGDSSLPLVQAALDRGRIDMYLEKKEDPEDIVAALRRLLEDVAAGRTKGRRQ